MNRRSFLKRSAGLALGAAAAGCAPRAAARNERPLDRIGVQLYTVRDRLEQDFEGTVAAVAGIGYREVEFAGYYDRTPEAVRALLDRLHLSAPSTHVGLNLVQGAELDRTIRTAQTIGHRYVIVPSLPRERRESLDAFRRTAEEFNQIGRRLRQEGLQFGYHNHAFEFEETGGRMPYDVLLAETDPDLVKMEIDLYWITYAGQDPLAYFERHPGRFPLFHVKDMTADRTMTSVGAGQIDFPRIFAQGERAGLRHIFVEHDRPESSIDSIRASFLHLDRL